MINLFKDKHIKKELNDIHKNYVIVNADKASNNIIIICKKYYMECIINELNINFDENNIDENDNKNNNTSQKINKNKIDIINTHKLYMKKYKININKDMMELPNFYALPKMHKKIPKMRYIAASNHCTTKQLSKIITKCLKLITHQHKIYCNTIFKRTGVNRMWIINNSNDVLDKIDEYNDNKNIKNINTYDFSTLYTNIPHDDLKDKIIWVIKKAFYNKKYIYISKNNNIDATWNRQKNSRNINETTLIKHITYLIDNIYICVNNNVFRQVIGIPMGTDCAPFLANLYLYALEYSFLENLTNTNINLARQFSNSYRYIDDLLTFNNYTLMDKYKHKIYPKELILNKENKKDDECNFLDINININNITQTITTKLYDKRNDFNFTVNNFPIMSSNILFDRTHGIIISQLLRYSKVCIKYNDFINVTQILINKLTNQYFNIQILKTQTSNFYDKYYHMIQKYNCTKKKMIKDMFLLQ